MPTSLKEANRLGLYGLMAANLGFFHAVTESNRILAGDWGAIARDAGNALPAGIAIALTGIVNAQLSATAKARLAFWRWNNPLPGCEAFSRHAADDPRVDTSALNRLYGPLPTEPRDQNTLWYKLYRSVDSVPSVVQAHRAFLFARDYASLAFMLVLLLGTAGFIQISSLKTAAAYLAILVLQYVLASRAARVNGRRLVTTVLALKAAEEATRND